MIVEAQEITVNGKTFNTLTMASPYWACGHLQGDNQIRMITDDIDEPMGTGSNIYSQITGFASDDYDEFQQEIINRGLIKPPVEEPVIEDAQII